MKVTESRLDGVLLIQPEVFRDNRGEFVETYNERTLREHGIRTQFVQDNQSVSHKKGTIRGLHFQRDPMAQSKLVRVITGSIFDVVVDLRPKSPTYGKWEGYILTAESYTQLFVPGGFAHGFCTLEQDTLVSYKVDNFYSREHEGGILWCDEVLNIDWGVENPVLSDKDRLLPKFSELT